MISVTQLLAKEPHQTKQKKGLNQNPSPASSFDRIKKSVRGTEVHQFLESLKYSPEHVSPENGFEVVSQFIKSTKGQFLQELMSLGEVEWGFSLRLGTQLLRGQVDLWGQDREGDYWVVDYKTGNPEYAAKASEQLQIYAWALRKLKKVPATARLRLAAVFPFDDQVVIEEALGQEQIHERLLSQLARLNGAGA